MAFIGAIAFRCVLQYVTTFKLPKQCCDTHTHPKSNGIVSSSDRTRGTADRRQDSRDDWWALCVPTFYPVLIVPDKTSHDKI